MDQPVHPEPIARARALGPSIADAAPEIERTQAIPPGLLREIHAARLYRLLLPRAFGGEEAEPWAYFQAVEEVSRHDGSVGWCMFVANSSALLAAYMEPGLAHAIFDDPQGSIAWGPPGADRARAVRGGYRLSGRWSFASGCRHATWMGAHCQVVEPDGGLRLNRSGRPALATLLFPIERARLLDDWNVIGLRGTASVSYVVEDMFVPEAHVSTREDPELVRERGRLYAFPQQTLYPVGAAAVGAGLARGMLDAFVALATHKSPRNLGLIARDPWTQVELARQEGRLQAARAFVLSVLREIWDDPAQASPVPQAERARLRLAVTHALDVAIATGEFVWRAAGTDAIASGSAFERRFRDLHTVSQQIQARVANFETLGKLMLGQEVTVPVF